MTESTQILKYNGEKKKGKHRILTFVHAYDINRMSLMCL